MTRGIFDKSIHVRFKMKVCEKSIDVTSMEDVAGVTEQNSSNSEIMSIYMITLRGKNFTIRVSF